MRVTRELMLERFLACDRAWNGRFLTGVRTTGIYCLPSCSAKKPLARNVDFYPDEDAAQRAGLRACKRCRPDLYYRQRDPERERISALLRQLRATPEAFADASALARAADVGTTKLNELFRAELHATPAGVLAEARVAAASEALLFDGASATEAGLAAGFESASAFHENFRRLRATTPAAYGRLGQSRDFTLQLPEGFRRAELQDLLLRSEGGFAERVQGHTLTKALCLAGRPRRLELTLGQRRARVRLLGGRQPGKRELAVAHDIARRLLGLGQDPGPFERRVRRSGSGWLVQGRTGLRIPQSTDVFEGLVWVIVGQQVNLSFASTCRDRLIELCARDAGDGFCAHPEPADVARLEPADLLRLQYSRRKAEYLIDTSRAIVAGELELEGLRSRTAGEVSESLLAVRGLGPWSVRYLLMRALGFADCVPVGDSGLVTALQRAFDLPERPDVARTEELMAPFAPYRSFATFHLWRSLGDPAT